MYSVFGVMPRTFQRPQIVMQHHMLHAGQGSAQLGHHAQAIKVATAKRHAVTGNQHLGLNLFEAIQHRVGAHVRRANAPHPANAHGGQKRHHRLGYVGQVGRNPVPRLHPLRLQVQGERRHLLAQRRPAQLPGWFFAQGFLVVADDRWQPIRQSKSLPNRHSRFHMAKHLMRVVDPRSGEPLRVNHPPRRPFVTHFCIRCRRAQIKIVPNALPKPV